MLVCSRYACMSAGEKLRAKKLPNFLIVGAQKTGTTSLFDILNQHSQIYLPQQKEIHFFDVDESYAKGKSFYSSFFSEAGNAIAVGEASPSYLFLPNVPERIFETLGSSVKIIIVLRNPADRAFSQYKMLAAMGHEKRGLDEVLQYNLEQIRKALNFDKRTSYLDRGMYAFQIENYFRVFPKENIRVYLFEEDFLDNRKQMIYDLQAFLGVETENISTYIKAIPYSISKSEEMNKVLNTAHPLNQFFKRLIPSKKLRVFLKYHLNQINSKNAFENLDIEPWREKLIQEVFIDDIKKTEKLIGRKLSRWYE